MSNLRRLATRTLAPVSTALLLLLVSGFATPAAAQVADHKWELSFGVGSANLDSSNEELDLDIRSEGRVGYFVSDRFELEVQVLTADAILDAQLAAVMANGVFNFRSDQRVVPYAMVGAGYYELNDISLLGFPEEDESGSAYQAGFGGRVFLGTEGRMAVRMELSSLWIDTGLFDQERHTSLTAGLSWSLGRR